MTDISASTDTTYVVRVERVRQSVEKLLERDTHPFFIAYLWLRRQAVLQGQTAGIEPNWAGSARYIDVPGGPRPNKPLLRPFWKGTRNNQQEWLNANLAGSFAPSSFRGEHITPVVSTDAEGLYVLQEDHWHRALQYFLYDQRLPAVALGGYLLRNFGFVGVQPPSREDLAAAFRTEFRYDADHDHEFDVLYETDWPAMTDESPWFEPLAADDGQTQ